MRVHVKGGEGQGYMIKGGRDKGTLTNFVPRPPAQTLSRSCGEKSVR